MSEAGKAMGPDVDLTKFTVKQLVDAGVEVRDELREETRKFKLFKASADDLLLRIGMALKVKGDEQGVDSFSTEAGTAYRNEKTSYRVGDWNLVLTFIRETENWQMLEKRIGKIATREIHKSEIGLPPGVLYHAEEVFVLRRPNERKESSDE